MATLAPTSGYTFGAALTWTQQEYGYLCHEVESFPNLPFPAAVSQQIVTQNGDRLGLVIVNVSINPVFIGLSNAVASNNGILLSPSGGSISTNVRQDETLPSRAWFGIATTAPVSLYVLEIIGWKKLPSGYVPGS